MSAPATVVIRRKPRVAIRKGARIAAVSATAEIAALALQVGLPGAKGDPGPPGAAFEHVQASASASWVINHNLGFRPAVSVLSPGGLEVEADVQHISANQAVISFVTPQSGSARFV